jgi:hypothetical protein
LKDESLTDFDNIPEPAIIADEVITNLKETLSLMNNLSEYLVSTQTNEKLS